MPFKKDLLSVRKPDEAFRKRKRSALIRVTVRERYRAHKIQYIIILFTCTFSMAFAGVGCTSISFLNLQVSFSVLFTEEVNIQVTVEVI